MAVQKSKKSPSRRGMRRSHDYLTAPSITSDNVSGIMRLRHNVGKDGFYQGRLVLTRATDAEVESLPTAPAGRK